MVDQPDNAQSNETDEIPVEELIRMTRQFTRRITNQDRQRLGLDLRESGHSRSIQITAPLTLQQFFSGEIDLDTDLARRFSNAPLMAHARFVPPPGQPVNRQATAMFLTNDESSTLSFDSHVATGADATLEVTFTMYSSLALRFRMTPLVAADRSRWLDLMRRNSGIAFLWTRERWENPYAIFVVRENFARIYAFSPTGFEAAARMTPDMTDALMDWLEDLWFPGRRSQRLEASQPEPDHDDAPLDWTPQPDRAARLLRAAIPDAPEEQWGDEPPPPPGATPAEPRLPTTLDDSGADESELSASDLEW